MRFVAVALEQNRENRGIGPLAEVELFAFDEELFVGWSVLSSPRHQAAVDQRGVRVGPGVRLGLVLFLDLSVDAGGFGACGLVFWGMGHFRGCLRLFFWELDNRCIERLLLSLVTKL